MSPPSDTKPGAITSGISPEFSPAERAALLALAHRSIESELVGIRLDLTPPSEHLAEPRGAFTTLHLNGKLRGCIGYVIATDPLYRTVAETARAAAFQDPRFQPVTEEEVASLVIEISVLSPLSPIRAEDVIVGRHGLLVAQGRHRGLLLPQVPLEWGWAREEFLAHTCRKAGLPPDAWRQDAELQAFTAEVFGDLESPESR